jgi:tetratricopeptide (TPR) repeat protein
VILALLVVGIVGALAGVALGFLLPTTGLFAVDRARAAIQKDTGAQLAGAAALAEDGDPALFATGALANTLLVLEHGGGAAERKRAEQLLKTTIGFVKNAPESLYARAALKRMGNEDPSLDDDIAKRADDNGKSPWWMMARALRALDEGKRDEAQSLLLKASLGPGAPAHAQTLLARMSIARGETGDARALTDRIIQKTPEHGVARMLGALAAVIDDVKEESPEERAVKLKKLKAKLGGGKRREGPPKPGEVHDEGSAPDLALWHTAEEDQALEHLEQVDERDAPLLALFLEGLAAARGDEALAGDLRARVTTAANDSVTLAVRQAELSMLEGDAGTGEEVLAHALEVAPSDPDVVLAHARLEALKLIPEADRLRRSSTGRALTVEGATLPFGSLRFDATATPPWRAVFDPSSFPDGALLTAIRSGATGSALEARIQTALTVFVGEQALARGDLAAASTAVASAREKASGDPDVLLLDARVRIRQGDRDAARDAVDAAVAAAPDSPHVLVTAARLHYDNESYIPARKVLKKLDALGFKSPAALALEAMLDARGGEARSASQALAEAQSIGVDNAEILAASVLILREGKDLDALRAAADKLLAVDQLHASDPILRAWEAEAMWRQGGLARAEAVLDDVIAARPNLPDAHLHKGTLTSATDPAAAVESFTTVLKLAPGSAMAAEATKKKAALGSVVPGAAPVVEKKPVKGKPLPRKKTR